MLASCSFFDAVTVFIFIHGLFGTGGFSPCVGVFSSDPFASVDVLSDDLGLFACLAKTVCLCSIGIKAAGGLSGFFVLAQGGLFNPRCVFGWSEVDAGGALPFAGVVAGGAPPFAGVDHAGGVPPFSGVDAGGVRPVWSSTNFSYFLEKRSSLP